ncbi:hypothetical protein HU200_040954 [Digitaria exilis]|uniref:Late embryogenesis abundant protein LEA-2 subgroup domain-containing protein n=1 Tax=Digitaria exilis TaxID=1010633 RepID=A0A835B823_9POAL|nr:hypothetical protein HU200_040954 [Digitaria exilis]CAB3452512.1 unnamed protein product [Digitaria exilis]
MGIFDDCFDDCRCCYNSCKDLWWCILCLTILFFIILIVILVAAFGFVRHADITVDDASLTHLALNTTTTPTTLAYNLTLALTIRNLNWAMAMTNTKPLDATYSFDGQMFDRVRLAGEGDEHPAGKTRVYRLVSGSGGAAVMLGNAGEVEFRKENATGVFEVEVMVKGEVKYTARLKKCVIEATCPLKLQLAPPGQAAEAVVFQKVKCKLAKAEKGC